MSRQKAAQLVEQAIAAYNRDDRATSAGLFQQAEQEDPTYAYPYYYRGYIQDESDAKDAPRFAWLYYSNFLSLAGSDPDLETEISYARSRLAALPFGQCVPLTTEAGSAFALEAPSGKPKSQALVSLRKGDAFEARLRVEFVSPDRARVALLNDGPGTVESAILLGRDGRLTGWGHRRADGNDLTVSSAPFLSAVWKPGADNALSLALPRWDWGQPAAGYGIVAANLNAAVLTMFDSAEEANLWLEVEGCRIAVSGRAQQRPASGSPPPKPPAVNTPPPPLPPPEPPSQQGTSVQAQRFATLRFVGKASRGTGNTKVGVKVNGQKVGVLRGRGSFAHQVPPGNVSVQLSAGLLHKERLSVALAAGQEAEIVCDIRMFGFSAGLRESM